jgi:hypothetical protein
MIVLAAAPLFTGRDVLRVAVGALLLLVAASAIRTGLDPSPSQAEQLVSAVLTIAIGGAIAVIATAARAAGGLDAIDAGRPGDPVRRLPDAHRPPDRPVPVAAPKRVPRGAPKPASRPTSRRVTSKGPPEDAP